MAAEKRTRVIDAVYALHFDTGALILCGRCTKEFATVTCDKAEVGRHVARFRLGFMPRFKTPDGFPVHALTAHAEKDWRRHEQQGVIWKRWVYTGRTSLRRPLGLRVDAYRVPLAVICGACQAFNRVGESRECGRATGHGTARERQPDAYGNRANGHRRRTAAE